MTISRLFVHKIEPLCRIISFSIKPIDSFVNDMASDLASDMAARLEARDAANRESVRNCQYYRYLILLIRNEVNVPVVTHTGKELAGECAYRKRHGLYPCDGSVTVDEAVRELADLSTRATSADARIAAWLNRAPDRAAESARAADRAAARAAARVADRATAREVGRMGSEAAVCAPVGEKVKADDPPERVCAVCMENRKDTAFQCGHTLCATCAPRVDKCPECRAHITTRIKLYGMYA